MINTIHKFLYQPVTRRDREVAEKKKQAAVAAAFKKRFQQLPGKLDAKSKIIPKSFQRGKGG